MLSESFDILVCSVPFNFFLFYCVVVLPLLFFMYIGRHVFLFCFVSLFLDSGGGGVYLFVL